MASLFHLLVACAMLNTCYASLFCPATTNSGTMAKFNIYKQDGGDNYLISYDTVKTGWTKVETEPGAMAQTGSSLDCTSTCSRILGSYTNAGKRMIGSPLEALGWTQEQVPMMRCVTIAGDCGATVPLYRHFKFNFGQPISYAYSTTASTISGYTRELFPLCYVWPSTLANSGGTSATVPTTPTVPTVTSLVQGSVTPFGPTGFNAASTVALVQDSGKTILFDTPMATDTASKAKFDASMSTLGMTTDSIDTVIMSHGHFDHIGYLGLFPAATHYTSIMKLTSMDRFDFTPLTTTTPTVLTPNVEIWSTPGHVTNDISLVVKNVPCCGTIIIAGDMLLNEQDPLDWTEFESGAADKVTGEASRKRMICSSNYVVAGHGAAFKVTDAMRTKFTCGTITPAPVLDACAATATLDTCIKRL